jgi:hypothetical protein
MATQRMARPVRKVISNGMMGLHQRIRSRGFSPRPRWVTRAPILINCAVPSTTFLARISERRFDRYAIFFHLHRHRQRPISPAAIPRSSHGWSLAIETLLMSQHCPGNARQFGSQRDHNDVGM